MQRVCYLRCPAAAVLLGNATTMKLCCDSLCRTCYYSPRATIWSFSVPNEPAHKSPSLCSIFLDFVVNWAEGLHQLNLSPVIIGYYKHLDILLFRIIEKGGQLGGNYTADGYLTYMVDFCPHTIFSSIGKRFSWTAIKRNRQAYLQQPGSIFILITQ